MKKTLLSAASLMALLCGIGAATWQSDLAEAQPSQPGDTRSDGDKMTDAAKLFLGTLYREPFPPPQPGEQANDQYRLHYMMFAMDSAERFRWDFFPASFRPRKGLPLMLMTQPQRESFDQLLRTSLSPTGYFKAEQIRKLETILNWTESVIRDELRHRPRPRQLENLPGMWTWNIGRNPDAYYVSVFGTPSADGRWGLRFEGHHLSLHWTIDRGRIISATPQFFGATPSPVESATQTSAVLLEEERLGRALIHSITSAGGPQRGLLGGTEPSDIVTCNATNARGRLVAHPDDRPVNFGDLSRDEQKMLQDLVREYASAQTESVARARLEPLERSNWQGVTFGWIGNPAEGRTVYYRIQGPSFVIEYDSFFAANHQHTVWRDFDNDWGGDRPANPAAVNVGCGPNVLAEHYRTAPHHAADRARLASAIGSGRRHRHRH